MSIYQVKQINEIFYVSSHVCLSVCLSIILSVCQSVCLPLSLSLSLSLFLFLPVADKMADIGYFSVLSIGFFFLNNLAKSASLVSTHFILFIKMTDKQILSSSLCHVKNIIIIWMSHLTKYISK